jgi:hypothetical protein
MVGVPPKNSNVDRVGASPHRHGHGIPKFQSISVPLSQRMPEQEPAASEAHGNNDEALEGKGYL